MSNTQRDNANAIFTSERLDKLDELIGTLKDLPTNSAKYYGSDTATASDSKGDHTCNLKTVTHTSNVKVKVADTSNGNF